MRVLRCVFCGSEAGLHKMEEVIDVTADYVCLDCENGFRVNNESSLFREFHKKRATANLRAVKSELKWLRESARVTHKITSNDCHQDSLVNRITKLIEAVNYAQQSIEIVFDEEEVEVTV